MLVTKVDKGEISEILEEFVKELIIIRWDLEPGYFLEQSWVFKLWK